VLLFSDIQIVTSLTILSAGYSQLHCGISSYDWQILVYTAWFSSVTHLTTLTVIWHWFRRKSRNSLVIRSQSIPHVLHYHHAYNRVTTNWKSKLAVGSLWKFHGWCTSNMLFKYIRDSSSYSTLYEQTNSMIVSITVLWVSYFTRVVKLF
jgi:hypothetical protein